jgi:hypothetical protein
MKNWHWFKFASNGILALFLGILVYVVIIAFQRHSGTTKGLDVATIQKLRYDAQPQPRAP